MLLRDYSNRLVNIYLKKTEKQLLLKIPSSLCAESKARRFMTKESELRCGIWCCGEVLDTAWSASSHLTEHREDQSPGTRHRSSIQCSAKAGWPVITATPSLCIQSPQLLGPDWA